MTSFTKFLSSASIGVLISFFNIQAYATNEHSADELERSTSTEKKQMPKVSSLKRKRTSSNSSSTSQERNPSSKKQKVGEGTQFQKDFLAAIAGDPEAEEKIYTYKKLTVEDESLIQEHLAKQNPHAQSLMGFLNLFGYESADGRKIEDNVVEAYRLSKLAADQGNARSQFRVGEMISKPQYNKYLSQFNTSMEEAIRYYTQAANNEYKFAQFSLGKFYINGISGCTPKSVILKPDINKAISYLTLAANQNVGEAQLQLGVLYKSGAYERDGTVLLDPNPELALYYLAKNQKDSQALYLLGMMFKEGVHKRDGTVLLDPSPEQAIHFLTLSAKEGEDDAVEELWSLLKNGISKRDGNVLLAPNPEQGVEVMTKFASEGNVRAKYCLGLAHMEGWAKSDGTVVPPSFRKSFNYLYDFKSTEDTELPEFNYFFGGGDDYHFRAHVPALSDDFIQKISKITHFIAEEPRWEMDISRLTSNERAELLKSKSTDMDDKRSSYSEEEKEDLSTSHRVDSVPEKEEPTIKETILSHFASKQAGLSVKKNMKREAQYWEDNKQKFDLKYKFYSNALNCLTDLQDINLLKFIFETDCLVMLPFHLENKLLMHDMPIFTSARNLDPIAGEDQIRIYDFNGTRYLTLGKDSIKKVDRFIEVVESLEELRKHYHARYNFLSKMEKRHKENLKVLQSNSYSKLFLPTTKSQRVEEEEAFCRAFNQKAQKALNKAKDLQIIEKLIKENLETAQPRKRVLLRTSNPFIGPLGEEEE